MFYSDIELLRADDNFCSKFLLDNVWGLEAKSRKLTHSCQSSPDLVYDHAMELEVSDLVEHVCNVLK